ncbi:hypothetical protein [Marinilabilia rubra]|uniref:Uncharacterized protein n=1 Tax=Marinilabilia rubra TaxID=2162893 RepID=A0A2U2B7T2_9BACT|nr:hypothetical protein [Marinilabilia rubra]PWD99141.1 hypothetical protein DDZ16_11105 [Marinilabilia rubra]
MQYSQYTPIDPDFYDIIKTQTKKSRHLKVFFFYPNNEIGQGEVEYSGTLKEKEGEFIDLFGDEKIRLDRIITINGNPGPAFDEYDAYANACLSCQAGYDD